MHTQNLNFTLARAVIKYIWWEVRESYEANCHYENSSQLFYFLI